MTTTICLAIFVSVVTVAQLASGQRSQQEQPTAEHCDPSVCRLPDCYCGGTEVPGGLSPEDIPQFVLLTFDDAVNGINKEFFAELFKDRQNPNGCPIKVSHCYYPLAFASGAESP